MGKADNRVYGKKKRYSKRKPGPGRGNKKDTDGNNNKEDATTLSRKEDMMATPSKSSTKACPDTGSRLCSFHLIVGLISQLVCPICKAGPLTLYEQPLGLGTVGFHSQLKVNCATCGDSIARTHTSETLASRASITNVRAVASARNCGIGFSQLIKLFSGMNVPTPMHLRTYQRIAAKVHQASIIAMQGCFKAAVNKVREYYRQQNPTLTEQSVIPISVSYDGSWHRRGHSSHHGVGTVIELETGLVIDTHIMSNFCIGCDKGPKSGDPSYDAWLSAHKTLCQKNYSGSACAMEVEAAKVIFRRSVDQYNLKYTRVLCDGDAKTVTTLNNAKIYTDTIVKEDCVNHVSKRLYNGIEKAKQASKGTKHHLSGKGRITQKLQKQLSVSYGQALKDGAPDVHCMQRAVMASLYHRMSTDANPQHQYCPAGDQSWCKYQVETSQGVLDKDRQYVHKAAIKPEYGEQLLPIYTRLSTPDLLERCTKMRTTNANESFNAQIWRRAPKHLPVGKDTVETAVAMAVLDFNKGSSGFSAVLENLDISPGYYFGLLCTASTRKRRLDAARHSSTSTKKRRLRKKLFKAGVADKHSAQEGVLYESGGFNS